MRLRPYQADNKNDIYNAWDHVPNVLSVNPTGSGKTVIFSDIINDERAASCAIAHRQELVSQISIALARNDIRHRIVGPPNVVRLIVGMHMAESGMSYYDPSAPCAVAGVDTLVRRGDQLANWLPTVKLWVQDEAHHVLKSNKWGTAAAMFPNARGLGVTATPERADGRGLGRHADGLFDTMVEGPSMRELINAGYLTDYRVFAPPASLIMSDDDISKATGDYKHGAVVKKFRKNKTKIIGDIVGHYLKHAKGKLGITFVPDVQDAIETAAEYNRQGISAAVVHAKTPLADRIRIIREFKARKLLQLVNVDLFGEGFDLPAIEVVSMARPTKSFSLYCQQFGRALRLMISDILTGAWDTYTDEQRRQFIAESTKPHAIIIDHVGNVSQHVGGHGLPDAPRIWTLDAREKRSKGDIDTGIPVRGCPACTAVYESINSRCPYCGHKPEPLERSSPEFVAGDLLELDPATLASMRGEINRIDGPCHHNSSTPSYARKRVEEGHANRKQMQQGLRASIAWWGAYQRELGRPDSESYRRFYFMFKIDVMSAQALNTREANTLAEKINNYLAEIAAA